MANTTFTGAVRSENGFVDITKTAATGAITTNSTFSNNTSIGGTLATTGISTLAGGLDVDSTGLKIALTTNYELTGLSPRWAANFGGPLAGQDQIQSTLNVLTPATIMHRLFLAMVPVASQTAVPTAAQAATVFGGTGVTGADVAIGTTGSPGTTPTVTQKISRLTGGVSGTVVMAAGADLASAGDETVILFTGNTFASSGVLKFTLNANNELDAESGEFMVSDDGGNIYDRESAPTDADQIIIMTDTGDCTIGAGSYTYLHAGNNTDVMSCKQLLNTSGGTIAITFGN
jgi:hypothetical protein